MADYQKLYALLCGVIDDVIDPLERIPFAKKLRRALVQAEELYIDTSAYPAEKQENVIVLQREGEQR